MRRGTTIHPVALAALLFLSGCSNGNNPLSFEPFDGQRAFDEVAALVAISPRDAGTANAKKAAEHIRQRLEHFGVSATIDTFSEQTPEGVKTFHNVIGRISGRTDRWIILGSHFDTKAGIANFQGANDGGSSTGVLIELSRLLAGRNPEIGIILAFFDGEEALAGYVPGDGLHGSRHMAAQLAESGSKQIKAMILLDMVGDPDLHIDIPANSSAWLVKEVFDAAHATGDRDRFSASRNSFITDDHVPFLAVGIPAIDLIDFHYGTKPGLNDLWHTPSDTLQNIDSASLEIVGRVTLQLIDQLAYEDKSD